jgi:hypothetical protein
MIKSYADEDISKKKERIVTLIADDEAHELLTMNQRIAAEQVFATLELADWVKDLATAYRAEHGLL